jgi:predicted murein hydrolase (TIGR00659 family)
MMEMIMNMPLMLLLTIGAYLLGVWVKKKSGLSLLHPFLISIPVIIAVLKVADIPCNFYVESNGLLSFLLGPSVVSLGLLLYDNRKTVLKNFAGIMSSVLVGSVVGVVSVYVLCRIFGMDEIFLLSLESKSVTTPIAMDISASLGGNVSLTAVSVVLCGFVGAILGPFIIRILKIKSPVARGLGMGCASHGLGTARAIEMGAVEGAVSGLAIALMGVATALLIPLLNIFLHV